MAKVRSLVQVKVRVRLWALGSCSCLHCTTEINKVALVLWVVGLCLFRKFRQAIFLAVTVGVSNGIDGLIGDFVGRPRPSPDLIHVTSRLVFNSFPSGHTEHDVVFYGFLLYLSFSRPVCEWRSHWVLLPSQIFAVELFSRLAFPVSMRMSTG